MLIQIDQNSQIPIYMQLRNQIALLINSRDLNPGDKLPSVRTLASDLGINLHTVNKAYALLREEGYITMAGRRRASVADQPPSNQIVASINPNDTELFEELTHVARNYQFAGGCRAGFERIAHLVLDGIYDQKDELKPIDAKETFAECEETYSQTGNRKHNDNELELGV